MLTVPEVRRGCYFGWEHRSSQEGGPQWLSVARVARVWGRRQVEVRHSGTEKVLEVHCWSQSHVK